MMMYDLPEDLAREILSRVPTTSLRRLRSTCKRWNDLFRDTEFIKMQCRKSAAAAAKESMVVILKEFGIYSVDTNLEGVSDPSTEVTGRLIALKDPFDNNSEQFMVDTIFYCGGLLLCTIVDKKLKVGESVVRLVVWNPCLAQTRWIESTSSYEYLSHYFALGYDSNNDYKILRVNYNYPVRQKVLEIYDCNMNSWKFLDEDIISDDWITLEPGMSLNGNAYWLGFDESEGNDAHMLISFDFSAEKFQRHCLPPLQYISDEDSSRALSVAREEQLLLLNQCFITSKMDIWVTTNNKIDLTKVLSWSKFLTVDLNTRQLCFPRDTRFFIVDEVKKLVVCCDSRRHSSFYEAHIIGEEEFVVIEIEPIGEEENVRSYLSPRPLMFSYVPSLVQIQHE